MSSGDVWIGQVWGADIYAIQDENENVVYYIPEEGGVRGSDTMAIFSGAKHPIAAHLFINHMLDAQVSAANTNFIGYMGPNAAAKEFIDPAILERPGGEPGRRRSSPSSRSCSTSARPSATSTSSAGRRCVAAEAPDAGRLEPADRDRRRWPAPQSRSALGSRLGRARPARAGDRLADPVLRRARWR